jgi:hypothetical protein
MADKKQIPLDELLFGRKSDATDQAHPTLAEAITIYFREGLAKSRRDQAAQGPSPPQPSGEPKP